jgi:ABC-2 type transport system permease protein
MAKTMADQRRGLIGWSLGLFSVVGAMGALWPTVRDMPDMGEFLQSYPEAVRDLFKIDQIATGPGYLNAELFSIIIPAMFIVFAVGRGSRLIAGDEEDRQLDVVLASPVSRTRVLIETSLGLIGSMKLLGLALFVATAATSELFGMGIGYGAMAIGSLTMTLLGIEHGLIALAAGAATGRRSIAMAAGGAIGGAGYVLYVVGEIVDDLKGWQALSPFEQVLANGPLGGELPTTIVPVALLGVVAVAVAAPIFERRDVGR